jgi:hypothetical protein
MKKILLSILMLSSFLFLSQGCAMLSAWKTIPPPGGCDQCHALPISYNWQLVYKAPNLSDERDRLSFQTEQGVMTQSAKPASSLEIRKMSEQQCFDCHRLPNSKHRDRKGSFHH